MEAGLVFRCPAEPVATHTSEKTATFYQIPQTNARKTRYASL